jgi:hypothetical protein
MIELKNSKTIELTPAKDGRRRFAVDGFIGAVQMREPGGPWQDIRPRLVRDADGWHIEGAPYYAEIKDDGSRLFCPDRNERNKYLHLPAPALFAGLERNVVQNPTKLDFQMLPNQITIPAAWGEYRIIFSNTGMHFEIYFAEAPPASVFGKDSPRILLDADAAGIDIGQLLESRKGLGIPRPRLIAEKLEAPESTSQERWLDWNYKNGQLELGFDFGELEFPILLQNTTVDISVGASSDDACENDTGATSIDSSYITMYSNNWYGGFRFLNVDIPSGATIGVAYTKQLPKTYDDPREHIYCELSGSPSTFTTGNYNISTRSKTTNYQTWEADNVGVDPTVVNSPSIVDEVQEVVDTVGAITNLAVIYHHTSGVYRFHFCSWDYPGHSKAPAIYIEYSAGGPTAKTAAETGGGAEGSLLETAISRADIAGGVDARQSLLASLTKADTAGGMDTRLSLLANLTDNESGVGVEQSLLESLAAKLSTETGYGSEAAALMAGLAAVESGLGVDVGWLVGLKSILSGDGGVAADALKALVGTSSVGSEMKLPGRQGHVKIPSKGVNL